MPQKVSVVVFRPAGLIVNGLQPLRLTAKFKNVSSYRGDLTGHVEFAPLEPLDLPPAQIAVLNRVKSSDPAQSVTRHSGPELLTVGHRKLLQRRPVRHPFKARSLRHKRRDATPPPAESAKIGPGQPSAEDGKDALGGWQHCCIKRAF